MVRNIYEAKGCTEAESGEIQDGFPALKSDLHASITFT